MQLYMEVEQIIVIEVKHYFGNMFDSNGFEGKENKY